MRHFYNNFTICTVMLPFRFVSISNSGYYSGLFEKYLTSTMLKAELMKNAAFHKIK